MAAGPLAFKETDVARAVRAANKAAPGAFAVRIERATGDILILPFDGRSAQGVSDSPATVDNPDEDLDRELAEWEAKQRG